MNSYLAGNGYAQGNTRQDQFVDAALEMAVASVGRVWKMHCWRVLDAMERVSAPPLSQITKEFFFCLLGGYGITYEANWAAYAYLEREGCLKQDWFAEAIDHEECLARLLKVIPRKWEEATPASFQYRFPNAKARVVVAAANWLETTFAWDLSALSSLSPQQARRILLDCPGMGYKTASWFLRNIGNGAGLAIVDVHVERLAKEWAIVPHGLTAQRDYLEIEQRLIQVCDLVCAPIDLLDLVLWHYARGDYNTDAAGQSRTI